MQRSLLTFLILILFCSVSSFAQSTDSDSTAYKLYKRTWNDQSGSKDVVAKADSILKVALGMFTADGNSEMMLRCRNRLGWSQHLQGDSPAAIKSLEAVVAESNALVDRYFGVEGQSFYYLGRLYIEVRELQKSEEAFEKALELTAKGPVDDKQTAEIHYEYGEFLTEVAQINKARYHANEAERLFIQLHGEKSRALLRIYELHGFLFQRTSDYFKSLLYYQKSVEIAIKHKGENSKDVASLYNNMSTTYYAMQDFENSLKYMTKSLEILENYYPERLGQIAQGMSNLGLSYRATKQPKKALELYKKTLSIEEELYGKDALQSVYTFINTGLTYRDLNDFDKAIEYGLKSQEAIEQYVGPRHPYTGKNLVSIAIAEAERKNYKQALEYCRLGFNALIVDTRDSVTQEVNLEITKSTDDSEEYLRAFYVQALILLERYHSTGNLQDLKFANDSYKICDQIIDKNRRSRPENTIAVYNSIVGHLIYPEAVHVAYLLYEKTNESQYLEEAFCFAEKGKGSLLLQSSSESLARQFSGVPQELFDQEQALKQLIAGYESELISAVASGDKNEIKRIRDEALFTSILELEGLIKSIEQNYPSYGEMKYNTVLSTVKDIQASLNDKTVLIEYVINNQSYEDKIGEPQPQLYAFVIGDSDATKVSIDWPESMAKDITELHKLSQKTSIVKNKNKARFIDLSNKLYQKLLQPIESQIADKEHLVIVGDGVLNYLPFELLLKNKEQKDFKSLDYLIKDYEISYHYSATLFSKQKEQQTFDKDQLLAFAPVFDTDISGSTAFNENTRSMPDSIFQSMRDNRFVPLYWSEKEVTAINNLFESKDLKNNTILLHDDANESNLKKLSTKSFKYIHIASHSFSNLDQPRLSGIACSASADAKEEDGILYVGEIYNLSLNADLVVLSSCESGIGKLLKGEGMLGINRSFIYAGTPNIVFSLWKVNDEKSSKLMTAFYENMLNGQSYSKALRSAKLHMLEDEVSALPVYWSPFVLIGK